MSSKTKSTATTEEESTALVPKLRFPEFRKAKGWENKFIGPYLEDCSGRVPPDTELPVYSSTREGLKRQDSYFDGRVLQNKNEYGMVPPGCLVYRHMSDDGLFKFNINETGGEIAVSKEYPVFGTKGLNPVFLLAKLNDGLDFKHFALSQKAGGTRTRLYFSRLCEWRTLLPSPAEQQKIAECLSSVDELMAAQARKVDALKTHKKGLMQQLFPGEGETQPRRRFPEFQNAGEWKTRELSDFITERNEYPKEKVPLFSLTIEDGVTPKTERYERSFLVNDEADAYKLVLPNDFAFNPMNLRFGAIGRHSGTEQVAVSKYYNIFSCDKTVDFRFCEIYFRSERMVAFYDDRAIGSLIEKRRVHFAAFLKFNIRFPRLPEQQRIATCLSSLDALITAETQRLEALKTHKKGLMQQLFPSAEEVEA